MPSNVKILSGKIMQGQYSQDTEEGRANLFVVHLKVFAATSCSKKERVFLVVHEDDEVATVPVEEPSTHSFLSHVCSFPLVGCAGEQYHLIEHNEISNRIIADY